MRKIEGTLYRIGEGATGKYKIVECNNENELVDCVAEMESMGFFVSSVTRLDVFYGEIRSPKVAIKSNPRYKEAMKKLYKRA